MSDLTSGLKATMWERHWVMSLMQRVAALAALLLPSGGRRPEVSYDGPVPWWIKDGLVIGLAVAYPAALVGSVVLSGLIFTALLLVWVVIAFVWTRRHRRSSL